MCKNLNFGDNLGLSDANGMFDFHKQLLRQDTELKAKDPASLDTAMFIASLWGRNIFVFDMKIFHRMASDDAKYVTFALGAHKKTETKTINGKPVVFDRASFTLMAISPVPQQRSNSLAGFPSRHSCTVILRHFLSITSVNNLFTRSYLR